LTAAPLHNRICPMEGLKNPRPAAFCPHVRGQVQEW
jgi:hypothetical protein